MNRRAWLGPASGRRKLLDTLPGQHDDARQP
jgi:hypothetical protein